MLKLIRIVQQDSLNFKKNLTPLPSQFGFWCTAVLSPVFCRRTNRSVIFCAVCESSVTRL